MSISFKDLIFLLLFSVFFSCTVQIKISTDKEGDQTKDGIKIIVENTKLKTYKGWWVYGEGQHIFKDQQTLKEYDLEFLNENMEELRILYLAVCEMEYFPMECNMIGHLESDTLIVADFEITYIQGCGE